MSAPVYLGFYSDPFPEDDYLIELTAEQVPLIRSAIRMVMPDSYGALIGVEPQPFEHLCLATASGPGGEALTEIHDNGDAADLRPSEIAAAEGSGRVIAVDMECDGDCESGGAAA